MLERASPISPMDAFKWPAETTSIFVVLVCYLCGPPTLVKGTRNNIFVLFLWEKKINGPLVDYFTTRRNSNSGDNLIFVYLQIALNEQQNHKHAQAQRKTNKSSQEGCFHGYNTKKKKLILSFQRKHTLGQDAVVLPIGGFFFPLLTVRCGRDFS